MDKVPFFEFNLTRNYDKKDVEEFQKFDQRPSKSAFDLDNIVNNANELKYVSFEDGKDS